MPPGESSKASGRNLLKPQRSKARTRMENGTGTSTVDSVRDRGAEARHTDGLACTVELVPQQLQTGFRCPWLGPSASLQLLPSDAFQGD